MTINMIKCIQFKRKRAAESGERERRFKMMKRELTMEELELVNGGINMDAAIKYLVSHAHTGDEE